MIVPDINLLLYAHIDAFLEHEKARAWWERCLNGGEPVGIALPALFGFVRIATNPRIFDTPMQVEDALAAAESWFAQDAVRPLLPGHRHLEIAFRFLKTIGTAANLTTDVQLAALAIEHQAELHSADLDFGRFQGLRWVNPLAQ